MLAEVLRQKFPPPLQENENRTFNRIRDRLTLCSIVAIAIIASAHIVYLEALYDSSALTSMKEWIGSRIPAIQVRFEDLDSVRPGYSASFAISLITFPAISFAYAAVYLVALHRSWKHFDVFRPVGPRNAINVVLSVLIITLAVWTLFFHEIGPNYHGASFKFIFFPPTFVVLSLLTSILAAGILILPIVFVAKMRGSLRSGTNE